MYYNIIRILILTAIFYILFLLKRKNQKLKNIIKEKDENIQNLKKDIKDKLKKAQDIHRRMLPNELRGPEDFLISDYYKPAEYIGGDYYNLFKIDHASMNPFFNQYLFYFFDVSGHGIDSTLLSIFINDSIKNYFELRHDPGEMISTKELMSYIDQRYQGEKFPDDYLLCMFIGVFDLDKKQLEYSARGFQFPFYKIVQQENIGQFDIGGLPISTAIGKRDSSNKENKIDLKKNTSLFFSTDGLFESKADNKNYYDKIDNLLKKYSFLPAPYLNDIIQKDFYNFMGNNDIKDDITYLIMDYLDEKLEEGDFFDKDIEQNYLKNLKTNLVNFIENNEKQIEENNINFKFADDSSKFILVIENKNSKINWDNFLKEEFESEFIFMDKLSYHDLNLSLFEKNKIFISKNKLENKIYFLIFKN